jgi:hypothetical protein
MRLYRTYDNSYPFTGPNAAWPANGSSKWISPQGNEDSDAGGAPNDPVGTYVYETTVDLTGFDLATVKITGRVYTDNNLARIYVNGVSTGISGGGLSGSDFTLPPNGLVAGRNKIEFHVVNTIGRAANPSGLRVSISGTAVRLTTPSQAVPLAAVASSSTSISSIPVRNPTGAYLTTSKTSGIIPQSKEKSNEQSKSQIWISDNTDELVTLLAADQSNREFQT